MPIQSPAKDLRRGSVRAGARNGLSTAQRKTSAGALFGQGREKVSEQPTGRPRKALQRSVRCCWSCFAVFRSIWAKNKGSTRYTDAPLVRETDVRAVTMPSLLMVMPPVTGEHHTNCNTRSPRKFQSARCRGLPCGNQSEPSGFRRQPRYGSFQARPA